MHCGNFKAVIFTTFIKGKNRERSKILNKACNTCVAFTFNDQQKHTEIQSLRWTMNIVYMYIQLKLGWVCTRVFFSKVHILREVQTIVPGYFNAKITHVSVLLVTFRLSRRARTNQTQWCYTVKVIVVWLVFLAWTFTVM